jgi:hypothetical protein
VPDSHDPSDFPVVFQSFPRRLASPRGGWDIPCPCLARHRNQDRRWSARLWRQGKQLRFWCGRGCKWAEAVEATGTRTTDWWINEGRTMSGSFVPASKPVAEYSYYDFSPTGQKRLAYQVVRTEPKGFFQRRPAPDGKGWVNFMGKCWTWIDLNGKRQTMSHESHPHPGIAQGAVLLEPVRRVPYHWPELRGRPDDPVYVVEGEKAADAIAELGFLATCSPGGAGKWPVGFGGHLTGRRVAILPDNDEPGEEHAALVAGSLVVYHAAEVRVLMPNWQGFDLGPGEDVYDWLRRVAPDSEGLAAHDKRRRALSALTRRFDCLVRQKGQIIDTTNAGTLNYKATAVKGEKRGGGKYTNAARAKVASTTDPVLG